MEEDKEIQDEDLNVRIVDVGQKTDIIENSLDSCEIVRLTPTGKISHAKTRVYTQRYRKDWEYMSDFKGKN